MTFRCGDMLTPLRGESMPRSAKGVDVFNCRLIVDPPATGAWNMAVDEALLADAIENGIATLRLYEWSEPTLSLGYFQQYAERDEHAASRSVAVVRRQSGGGAILHDHELTYSLSLPAAHPLAHHADKLYTAVHNAAIELLTPYVTAAGPEWTLRLRCDDCATETDDEPFLCFQRRAAGDLVLAGMPSVPISEATSTEWKILGSAQRRRQGAILQHGSLLLQTSPAAPELPGVNDLTGSSLTAAGVAAELPNKLARVLGMELQRSNLSEESRQLAGKLEPRKYGRAEWTKRR